MILEMERVFADLNTLFSEVHKLVCLLPTLVDASLMKRGWQSKALWRCVATFGLVFWFVVQGSS